VGVDWKNDALCENEQNLKLKESLFADLGRKFEVDWQISNNVYDKMGESWYQQNFKAIYWLHLLI
jgi:membrane-associated PAP2 superfamily phosphatase